MLFYKEVYDTGGCHKGFQNYANNKTFIEPDLISCSQTSIYTLCVWLSDPISVHRHTIHTGHRSAEPDEPDEDTKTDQGSNQTTVSSSSDGDCLAYLVLSPQLQIILTTDIVQLDNIFNADILLYKLIGSPY